MFREIVIEAFLFFFKCIFVIFKWLPLKNKITFVISFGQNSRFVYRELFKQDITSEIVFLCKKNCGIDYKEFFGVKIINFEITNVMDFLKSIYHLATSQYIIVDNYYAFLSRINFKNGVQCIQLWHAAGAIKTFGFRDRTINNRKKVALKRFSNVYKKFNKIVVGSEAMANIFIEAFQVSNENILRTGVPRTDLFYDKELQKNIINKMKNILSNNNKKVILYAPTYRDNELSNYKIHLNIDLLYEELKDDFILILKLHPALRRYMQDLDSKYLDFVYDMSSYSDVNELLLVTDYLITDYSSIPFEFSLLNRPMIFYPYDLKEYTEKRGLWGDYASMVPGPVVFSTEGIIDCIKKGKFDFEQIRDFANKWNTYSKGESSKNLITYLYPEKTRSKYVREVL
jgi:CDP-glycerol glycerophosphotransferase (TagB/SpsB family)